MSRLSLLSLNSIRKGFEIYLLFLLAGYVIFNRGFAYLGRSPVYVSEVGLLIIFVGFCQMLLSTEAFMQKFRNRTVILLLAFLIWQAIILALNIGHYGIVALRDSVVWIYAAYALFILALFFDGFVDKFIAIYVRFIPFLLIWFPLAFILVRILGVAFPSIAGSPVPFVYLKPGDVNVHLAGIATALLLKLDSLNNAKPLKEWSLWGLWWLNWILYGSITRAGMLCGILALFLVALWQLITKTRLNWVKPLITLLILGSLLRVTNVRIPVIEEYRKVEVSYHQIAANFLSPFYSLIGTTSTELDTTGAELDTTGAELDTTGTELDSSGTELDSSGDILLRTGTIRWRLDWWEKIINDTLLGDSFWLGKGYGINLADEYGFQGYDRSLRSPHNVFMTILARSGVPGLIFWLIFLVSFSLEMVKSILAGSLSLAKESLWIFVYLMSFLFNASFDVFLEGPMGGIWFWSLIGIGLVIIVNRSSTNK
jgi:hypothetical protein